MLVMWEGRSSWWSGQRWSKLPSLECICEILLYQGQPVLHQNIQQFHLQNNWRCLVIIQQINSFQQNNMQWYNWNICSIIKMKKFCQYTLCIICWWVANSLIKCPHYLVITSFWLPVTWRVLCIINDVRPSQGYFLFFQMLERRRWLSSGGKFSLNLLPYSYLLNCYKLAFYHCDSNIQ